jgi:hypothetical protein
MSRPKQNVDEMLIAHFATCDIGDAERLLRLARAVVNARAGLTTSAAPRKTRSDAGKPRKVEPEQGSLTA